MEKKQKDSGFKKEWDDFLDEIDHILAFGISYNEDKKGNIDIDHIALLPKEDHNV